MSSERQELVVVLDAPELGLARPVGVVTRWPGHTLSVAFAYARSWLRSERAFTLDPSLPLVEHTTTIGGRRLPGILADTTPDRWGELLLRRQAGHELDAWGHLVGVADLTRMGALRLRRGVDGPFVSEGQPAAPSMARIGKLQDAARLLEEDPAGVLDPEVARLLAPGSSLGGARPKANVLDAAGRLWIAKLPASSDRHDVGAWECIYARLASASGIDVPETELQAIGGRARTFLTRRFDRTADGRRLYASAQTLTSREHAAGADYLDIARAIREHVAADAVRHDLAQLFRRMVFNVLAGNRDDHLRNLGFLRSATGWRLAPAFDMNPARETRGHVTTVGGREFGIRIEDLLELRPHFGLDLVTATRIIADVTDALGAWRAVAGDVGVSRAEQDRVAAVISLRRLGHQGGG